jgi:hypothetical protein
MLAPSATPQALVWRTFQPAKVNAVLNDPGVLPWIAQAGQERLDATALLSDRRNVALLAPIGGVVLFHFHEPTVYEVHTQFIEGARGAGAIRAVREAIWWMFTRTDAMELLTRVPCNNPAALGLVRAIHGRREYLREGEWRPQDGSPAVDCEHYALRYWDWLYTASGIERRGADFHAELEQQCEELGIAHAPHPRDSAHDRAVGATVDTIRAGQVDKALILYNRWARFAGYAGIGIVQRYPLVLDLALPGAFVAIGDDGSFEVELCP